MDHLTLELLQRMQILHIPGLSIRVAQNGTSLFAQDLGVSDISTGEPLDSHHVFRIGCLTKPFVAHAVLHLVEQGCLDCQITIDCIIPELNTRQDFSGITIAQLLCHTAGLARGPYYSYSIPDDENLVRIGSSQLIFRAGEYFKYSNLGYFLLGKVIERITGKRVDEFIAEAILTPFGIHRTGFSTNKDLTSDLASGYWKGWYFGSPDLSESSTLCPQVLLPDSAAGMISCADDCLRWLIALTGGSEKVKPIAAAVVTEMLKDRHSISNKYSSCFGLYAESICADRVYFFSGDSSGYSGFIFAVPSQGLSGVALCNHSSCTNELKDILHRVASEVMAGIRLPNFGRSGQHFDVVASNRSGDIVHLNSGGFNGSEFTRGGQRISLYPHSERVFYQLNGSDSRNVLRVSGRSVEDTKITIGNQAYYANTCRASNEPTPSGTWAGLCDLYHCDSFGMVEVLHREGSLYLSYGAMYETLLQPTGKMCFRQHSGPFRYETVYFQTRYGTDEVASFSMNEMVFLRQSHPAVEYQGQCNDRPGGVIM